MSLVSVLENNDSTLTFRQIYLVAKDHYLRCGEGSVQKRHMDVDGDGITKKAQRLNYGTNTISFSS